MIRLGSGVGILCLFCVQLLSGAVVISIPLTAPGTGFISAALVDSNGVMARTIAYAEPVGAGTKTFYWDGTTDLGWPASSGSYSVRAIFFSNAPAASFVMKVGTSGNPPWRLRSGTGDWGGDLGGPSAIVANNSSLMLTWSAVENYTLPGVQQIDTNGNVLRSYISFYPWDGRLAGAMDDTQMFLGILDRDRESVQIARYDLGTSNKTILATLPTPPHYTLSGRWKNRWQSMLDGLAITPARIYASMAADNKLYVLNRSSGVILKEVDVVSPRGIAIAGDRLLMISSNVVQTFDLDGTFQSTLISGPRLDDPYAICVDRSGSIYISDGGSQRFDPERTTGNQQVHVFDGTGTFLRSIGASGGSPKSGAIVREAFGQIRSLCIGPDNKLWVNEEITGFKRTSRWTTNGVLEREWFQRKLVHHADLINPARPNEFVYVANGFDDSPGLSGYTVDWATGEWSPAWSYAEKQEEMFQEDVYLGNTHVNPLEEYQLGRTYPSFQYDTTELVTYQGRNYFLNHEGNGDGVIFTYGATNAPKAVGMIGYHRVDLITNRIVSYYDTGPNRWMTWADADGNGRIATIECIFNTTSEGLSQSKRIYDARLETNMSVRLLRPGGNGEMIESILPLKQILPNGAPVYDWSMLQDAAQRQMPSFDGGAGGKTVTKVNYESMPLPVGNTSYALLDPQTDEVLDLPSLDHFWADRNWRKRIAAFERDTGKFLWAAGRRAAGRAQRGEMYNVFGLTYSHHTLFASDVLGMTWLWSDQGLYLGRLLNDAEPGRVWDEYAMHAEVQGAVTVFTNSATGKLYMVVNDTGAHVYEVKLPRAQVLQSPPIILTPEAAAAAIAWDPDAAPPEPGTALTALLTANQLRLSWSIRSATMTLQAAPAVTGLWSTVTTARFTNGESVSVTLPGTSARQFFRLRE